MENNSFRNFKIANLSYHQFNQIQRMVSNDMLNQEGVDIGTRTFIPMTSDDEDRLMIKYGTKDGNGFSEDVSFASLKQTLFIKKYGILINMFTYHYNTEKGGSLCTEPVEMTNNLFEPDEDDPSKVNTIIDCALEEYSASGSYIVNLFTMYNKLFPIFFEPEQAEPLAVLSTALMVQNNITRLVSLIKKDLIHTHYRPDENEAFGYDDFVELIDDTIRQIHNEKSTISSKKTTQTIYNRFVKLY